MSPPTASLLLTGVKTLALRMAQHSASVFTLAVVMTAHTAIEQVNYPGLSSHPQHRLTTQMTGGRYSGVISLRLIDHERARNIFLDELTIPLQAVSLGDVASLVWPFDENGVIRLSVGIEDPADLVGDITRALDAVSGLVGTTTEVSGRRP